MKKVLIASLSIMAIIAAAGSLAWYTQQPTAVEAADPNDQNVYVSPNQNAMTKLAFTANSNNNYTTAPADDTTSTPNTEIIGHVLRKEPAGNILRVDAAAYFGDPSEASYFFFSSGFCNVYPSGRGGVNDGFVMVKVTYRSKVDNLDHSYYYPIHANNIEDCTYDAASPTVNTPNSTASTTGVRNNGKEFYANYEIPADFKTNAASDAETGGLYKLRIEITYDSNVATGNDDGANQQQIRFKINVPECSYAAGCRRYVAPVEVGSSSRNYSTVRLGTGNPQKFYTTQRFEFGLPCTATTAVTNQNVNFFDIDNNVDWDDDYLGSGNGLPANRVGLYVEASTDNGVTWTRLVKPGIQTFTTGDAQWRVPGDSGYYDWLWHGPALRGSTEKAKTDTIRITMQPHTRYRAVITPAHSMNLLGVGLPQDSVYGMINCSSFNGEVNSNKTVVSEGETINFTFQTRRVGANTDNIDYSYATEAWYETDYNNPSPGGKTRPSVSCVASGNRTHTPSDGLGPFVLLNCNNVPIDLGGNTAIEAICARLTLIGRNGTQVDGTNPITRCIPIAKYPALEVWNGDVRTGGVLTTGGACSLTQAARANNDPFGILAHDYSGNPILRGSRGQYGVTALGAIENFGSSGVFYDGSVSAKSLLFGSGGYTNGSVSYAADRNGYYYGETQLSAGASTFCLPDVRSIYQTAAIGTTTIGAASANPVIGDVSSFSGTTTRGYNFTASGKSLTIRSSDSLDQGTRVIIYVTQASGLSGQRNRVIIDDDITFTQNGYTSVNDLPQFVVIADGTIDIQIANTVSTVSGIYSTGGDIYTCNAFNGATIMTTGSGCDSNALTVRGALIAAGRVLPYRTYGYDTVNDTAPAELFNLSPSTLITDYNRAQSQPVITTDKLSELPTRL